MSQPTGLFAGAPAKTAAVPADPAEEGAEVEPVEGAEPEEGEEQDGTETDSEDGGDDPQAELAALRAENQRLKNEAAARRVKAKKAAVAKAQATVASKAQQGQAPTEDDIAAAEERGREAARLEHQIDLAQVKVEAGFAATGMAAEDIEGIVENLNLSRFVTEEGEIDDEAITALVAKFKPTVRKKPAPKTGHARTSDTPKTTQSEEAEFSRSLFSVSG